MAAPLGLRKFREHVAEAVIKLSGAASIVIVLLIFFFLLREGVLLFRTLGPVDFLTGRKWYPISEPPELGILPLIYGSLLVTLGAAVISIPLGVAAAIYIAEVAPRRYKEYLKSGIELLAAIPSVVLGFIGLVTIVPWVKTTFHAPTGLTAFSGSLILAFMAMPTIVSIAEDALHSVPKIYKEGAYALGATQWQTIYRVIVPAAASGIVAAVMLGIGRVVGETMAVLMITGNSASMPRGMLSPVRTLTATIAAEMGETVQGSEHYFSLFAIGLVLFLITFFINMVSDLFMHRRRR
ncbi:MAG TPA: phosphate ABC transporter permease subunit PstC [Candidatus Eisenbacteria bacterium]|nr:phosphate ABC transporter permease subunit PstC [Candidatus Eisenbacteria bacterium]